MENVLEEAQKILLKYKQNHIINFINGLDEKNKEELAKQILNIDFEELSELYKKTKEEIYTDLEEILPITAMNPERLPKERVDDYIKAGEKLIKENKFAVVTMAGGQGTRLRT